MVSGLHRLAGLAALALGAMLAAGAAAAADSGIDRSAMDAGVRAQDDLYRRANGAWLTRTEFPADKSYIGVSADMDDATRWSCAA